MRKLLVVVVMIIGFGLTTFAQSGGLLPTDTTKVKIGFSNNLKLHWQSDSLNYAKILNHPVIAGTLPDFKAADKRIFLGRPATIDVKVPHSYDNMPCLNPQGNFSIPVVRPDSSMKYTLLIKKIP